MSLAHLAYLGNVVIAATAVTLVLLERRFPYDRGQKLFREGFFNDFVLYTLVQSYVMGLIIAWVIERIDASTHVSRLHLVSSWPLWVQMLVFFVAHDFYIYWFHRAQHHSKYLWRVHEAHHATEDVDWLSGSRSHALEILINQTVEFAPIVLLGARPEVALFKGVIDAVWGMYIHSNVDVRSGRLQYFLNGPEMHRWHHAIEITEGGINFATKLAIWDYLFGTAVRPPVKPRGYGLLDGFPKNFFVQFVHAFRRFPESAPNSARAEAPMGHVGEETTP
ncbi:MAG TPA: sterol desaturase family protein [Polyangiaceae bacterium]|jgi:sterol desaturase/sphingolipid hydroxylase (fatty acid hydroxylase superfamily)|nr:sterol desaturase family protein [Polyangiaceae bacterium]